MKNLQEQVTKAFCYQKLFRPFTVWKNCSSDLKNFANSRPSASNSKSFSRSLEQFFLTVGQNKFGNKIPLKLAWLAYVHFFPIVCASFCSHELNSWGYKLDSFTKRFIPISTYRIWKIWAKSWLRWRYPFVQFAAKSQSESTKTSIE